MGDDLLTKRLQALDSGLAGKIADIATLAEPLLGCVTQLFPYYTRHDISHCRSVIEMATRLIPDDTQASLSSGELYLILAGCYLHDIGMAVSSSGMSWKRWFELANRVSGLTELDKIAVEIGSPGQPASQIDVKTFLQERSSVWPNWLKFRGDYDIFMRQSLGAKPGDDLFIFGEFVRENHHVFSAQWVASNTMRVLANTDPLLLYHLEQVCKSHGEKDLSDSARFPLGTPFHGGKINVQYVAIVLRIADLLDMSNSRAPEVLFRALRPDDPRSVEEWNRQMTVSDVMESPTATGVFNVGGVVTDPKGYHSLRAFLDYAKKEIDYCRQLLDHASDNIRDHYRLSCREISDAVIYQGFVPCQYKFTANPQKLFGLLMGEKLYGKEALEAPIRELLQNAVDTCRHRKSKEHGYEPRITVELDTSHQAAVLTVSDNGMGMNGGIVEKYFARIGESYYQSPEFLAENAAFYPVSRFGIGILSCFAVASSIEIVTRRNTERGLRVQLPSMHEYFILRDPPAEVGIGTSVILNLKPDAVPTNVLDVVRKWAAHVEIPIEVKRDGQTIAVVTDTGFDLDPLEGATPNGPDRIETVVPVPIHVDGSRGHVRGRMIICAQRSLGFPGGWTLIHGLSGSSIKFPNRRTQVSVGGIRVAGSGFEEPWRPLGSWFDFDIEDTRSVSLNAARSEIDWASSDSRVQKAIREAITQFTDGRLNDLYRAGVDPDIVAAEAASLTGFVEAQKVRTDEPSDALEFLQHLPLLVRASGHSTTAVSISDLLCHDGPFRAGAFVRLFTTDRTLGMSTQRIVAIHPGDMPEHVRPPMSGQLRYHSYVGWSLMESFFECLAAVFDASTYTPTMAFAKRPSPPQRVGGWNRSKLANNFWCVPFEGAPRDYLLSTCCAALNTNHPFVKLLLRVHEQQPSVLSSFFFSIFPLMFSDQGTLVDPIALTRFSNEQRNFLERCRSLGIISADEVSDLALSWHDFPPNEHARAWLPEIRATDPGINIPWAAMPPGDGEATELTLASP